MTFSDGKPILALAALLLACGGGGGGGGGGSTIPTGDNVMQITVNGTLCDPATSQDYPDKPCVEVTVCEPGTSTCQTIHDVLLDTASYGLRVFKQALGTLSLSPVTSGAGGLAECAQFADNSSDWGPVELADVLLANEKAPSVPIHVLDAGYASAFLPPSCPNPEGAPTDAGFNGILGVGVFQEDCGAGCEAEGNGIYFSCDASGCSSAAVPIADQVHNPVALLPSDNNGVIVELPRVGASGAASTEGVLVLGVGTRANNSLSGLTAFPVDSSGNFTTQVFGETQGGSFLDTGSNGLFFAAPSGSGLPVCTADADWYCPSSLVSFSAVNKAFDGPPSATVSFEVGNFTSLTGTSSAVLVFPDIGGTAVVGGGFDWGLPFYLGRNVEIGMSDTAPYVAYSP